MRWTATLAVGLLVLPQSTAADYFATELEGLPLKKVESSFAATFETLLDKEQTIEYQVRIFERSGTYYWASRNMKELYRSESGSYITFHAVDGSGYVRVGTPLMLDLRERLPEEQRRREIGYVEHLVTQFASITYYGNRK